MGLPDLKANRCTSGRIRAQTESDQVATPGLGSGFFFKLACAVIAKTKTAKVKTPLQPQQQRVVDKIQREDQPGLVVAHGLGSGKTLTAIAAQDRLQMPATVVVPAALQGNYRKELKKHHEGKHPKAQIVSMQNAAVKGEAPQNPMLVVDEAHRAREQGSKTQQVLKQISAPAQKRLLLTGTPFYNRPSDIAPLVNIAAGKKVMPDDRAEFEKRYIAHKKVSPGLIARLRGVRSGTVPTVNPKREKELRETFGKWVDYYEGSKEHFPQVEREDIKVPMTRDQLDVYDTAMGKAPAWVKWKVLRGLPPNKSESKQMNAYLSAVRQVSNTSAPFQKEGPIADPKVEAAYNQLKLRMDADPNFKAVVYSNYLDAGIVPYKRRLDEAKIPYGEFTGQMKKDERDELVKQYNANKLRALLLSSAGGEGLDLKGTRMMQLLEPHWNDEKLRQVEGRGIRFKSHDDLPEDQRKVLVQRYLATRSPKGVLERAGVRKPGMAVDEYLTRMSADKERLNARFRALLQNEEKERAQ